MTNGPQNVNNINGVVRLTGFSETKIITVCMIFCSGRNNEAVVLTDGRKAGFHCTLAVDRIISQAWLVRLAGRQSEMWEVGGFTIRVFN